jgi:terminase small subunit-like protein
VRAREIRADFTFGESIISIADDAEKDWTTAQNGRPIVNKELVLRSKLRIASRQLHMSRLHHTIWGDHKSIDSKDDWTLLSEHERRRRSEELIDMLRELREPPPGPPPIVYRPEEPDDDQPIQARNLRRL